MERSPPHPRARIAAPLALLALVAAGGCRTPPYDDLGTEDHSAAVTLGSRHSCALAFGRLTCWGRGHDAELDDGSLFDHPLPTRARLDGAVAVAAADDTTCALVDGGEVRCWGGECGECDETHRGPNPPQPVRGLGLAAQLRGSCALLLDGSVACWVATRAIDSTVVFELDPTATLPAAAALGDGPCAILADGSAVCRQTGPGGAGWVAYDGLDGALELVRSASATCARFVDGSIRCAGADGQPFLSMAMPGAPAVALSAGAHHLCALLAGGTVACWGENDRGQLGDGTTSARGDPVLLAGIASARHLALGGDHSCAALASGDLRCWGANDEGQLGDGTLLDRPLPVSIGYTEPIQ